MVTISRGNRHKFQSSLVPPATLLSHFSRAQALHRPARGAPERNGAPIATTLPPLSEHHSDPFGAGPKEPARASLRRRSPAAALATSLRCTSPPPRTHNATAPLPSPARLPLLRQPRFVAPDRYSGSLPHRAPTQHRSPGAAAPTSLRPGQQRPRSTNATATPHRRRRRPPTNLAGAAVETPAPLTPSRNPTQTFLTPLFQYRVLVSTEFTLYA